MEEVRKKIALSAIICFILVAAIATSLVPQMANAAPQSSLSSNGESSGGYSRNELHNFTKRTVYSNQLPAVTVLVHGQGGNGSHWSNFDGDFAYDELSIIEQIRAETNAEIYLAKVQKVNAECKTSDASHFHHTDSNGIDYYQCSVDCERTFNLEKVEMDSDTVDYTSLDVSNILDFDNHNIIIFEGSQDNSYSNPKIKVCGGINSSHDVAYGELELVIDSILADYKLLTGNIPKINLISHSRGGILSMMYAIDHPYNVANFISMGTPYNGSLFGKSNWIVDGLDLSGAVNCPSGQDIQSEEKQKDLRTKWNDMLKNNPNANINAVAIGSKTRLSFLGGLISEGEIDKYLKELQCCNKIFGFLTEYACAAIAQLHINFPIITDMVFECANIAVDVWQLFAEEGTAEEIEAIQQIINNCEIAYGDLVIKDDMFIDYDSQTAKGYDGIKIVTHVFDKDNANYNLTATNNVPVPHNLETRDLNILAEATLRLNYRVGHNLPTIDTVSNRINIVLNPNDFAKIEFEAKYSGNYTVTATSGLTQNVVNCKGNLVSSATNRGATFYGEKGEKYNIYIGSGSVNSTTADISVTLNDLSEENGNTVMSGQSVTYVKSYPVNSIKSIQFNPTLNINVYKDDDLVAMSNAGKVDVLFVANACYYFEVTNNTPSNVNLSVSIANIQGLTLGSAKTIDIYESYKYNSFTSSASGDYTFSFTRQRTTALPSLVFYDSNLQRKTVNATVNYGNIQVYRMNLRAGETVYFGYANEAKTIESAEVLVKKYTSDYSWKLDGKTIEDSMLYLQRNNSYSGVLSFYYNDQLLDGQITAMRGSDYIDVSLSNRVRVYSSAPLTYGDDNKQYVVWSPDGELFRDNDALTIIIIPKQGITLGSSDIYNYKIDITNVDRQDIGQLKETVTVELRITNSQNDVQFQNVTISNYTYIYDVMLEDHLGKFGSGNIRVETIGVTYSYNNKNIKYNKSDDPELFNDNAITLMGYFTSGVGFDNDPYIISNERELNNIRYTKYYDDYSQGWRITASFKLGQNIILQKIWTPIEYRLTGVFDGNGFTIENLKINVSGPGYYGLFSVMDGHVRNVNFKGVAITCSSTNNSNYTMVGTIAGLMDGEIVDCNISGSIDVDLYNSYVGGVVGSAQGGRIYNTFNNANVSGRGIIGGIVGFNSWDTYIIKCRNKGEITYTFDTESGCAAGIVGKNNLGGIIDGCTNEGIIQYGGSYKLNSKNRPCMAQIVGWNQDGTITGSQCKGKCLFKGMTIGQQTYCTDKEVGRTGN